jgi:membrane protease subunit HflC
MSQGKRVLIVLGLIVFFAILKIVAETFYIVDIREHAVVTQFGRPVRVVSDPGLRAKKPLIQEVRYFPKLIIEWDGEPSDILTRDKENIEVNTWARWRIVDPLKFYTSLGTVNSGAGVLDEVIDASVKNVVSSYPLLEVLRDSNRSLEYTTRELEDMAGARDLAIEKGRSSLLEEVQVMASAELGDTYGIELVDVQIKHINYVESVIPKIYDRMRSERIRIANRYESEGEQKREEILGELKRGLEEIESQGYRRSQEILGSADAEATLIYASAYERDPEFYTFLKTLETYEETIDAETDIVAGPDWEFYRFLKTFGAPED